MYRQLIFLFALLTTISPVQAREANNLEGADSPYLLQHRYNPVDWYPWGPEALNKARDENKPIFVSVGYSSCHWCHVMEEESFESEAIAALLNEHFVSIKIDRESRPDLDEQLLIVTQVMTGGGGWPNSVFLTPDGAPYFAGGYFPPNEFDTIVTELQAAWHQNPATVNREAAKIATIAAGFLTQKAASREITPDVVEHATQSILAETDSFYGGYGVAPKFPREPLFLFLLDHAERTGDREVLQAVTDMLDGMVQGGIHDHVGGGFHRYAIDPEWHVPHFEKMLYTQALTGKLLLRAWDITGAPRYRHAAMRLFDYVLREMQSPEGGFYSAQDADSLNVLGESVEGAYYMWSLADLAPLTEDAGMIRDIFQVDGIGDLDGANVLNLRALPHELALEFGAPPATFLSDLHRLSDHLYRIRSTRPAPFRDQKIVLAWNALMIETLAEAAERLERPEYYLAAEQAARFILEHMQTEKGLNRIWFEGSAVTMAQLPDYASFGLALIALDDFSPVGSHSTKWLQQAQTLADDLRIKFGPANDGFRITETTDGLGEFIPVDDTEIPSGNALALTLFTRLANRAQLPEIEQDAYRIAGAMSGLAAEAPEQRGFALKAIQELQLGETGPIRHVAKGAVRAELHYDRDDAQFLIDLKIADGWHINAHEPLEDYFIATKVSVDGVPNLNVTYPEARVKVLTFNDEPLALYEGHLQITAKVPAPDENASARRTVLAVQTCSDEICLQPENIVFYLW